MQITTLNQAAQHLYSLNIVDDQDMIEGKAMLEACGFNVSSYREQLSRVIDKHEFKDGVDFMRHIDVTHKKKGQKPWIYTFTIRAAKHVLLAAHTEKGKKARDTVIDNQEIIDKAVQGALAKVLPMFEDKIEAICLSHNAEIKQKDNLIKRKADPVSLTFLLNVPNGHKSVKAANFWLSDKGYQKFAMYGKSKGWELTEKGREFGVQSGKTHIKWTQEILDILPSAIQLSDLADKMEIQCFNQQNFNF